MLSSGMNFMDLFILICCHKNVHFCQHIAGESALTNWKTAKLQFIILVLEENNQRQDPNKWITVI